MTVFLVLLVAVVVAFTVVFGTLATVHRHLGSLEERHQDLAESE